MIVIGTQTEYDDYEGLNSMKTQGDFLKENIAWKTLSRYNDIHLYETIITFIGQSVLDKFVNSINYKQHHSLKSSLPLTKDRASMMTKVVNNTEKR